MCEVPNIVFQRARPAKSNIPREADLRKNSTLAHWSGRLARPAPAGPRPGARCRLPPTPGSAGPRVLREVGCGREAGGDGGGLAGARGWKRNWQSLWISASPILPPPHHRPGIGKWEGMGTHEPEVRLWQLSGLLGSFIPTLSTLLKTYLLFQWLIFSISMV